MDVNNFQTGMSQIASSRSCTSGTVATTKRSSSFSKSKSKKSLSYNPKELSSQILRARRTVGASQVLSRARAKLAMLKRAQATGEYDSAELENAIAHAKKMIDCADMKVSNLREEERIKKRAEKKAELREEQIRNARRLENIKKRTHRQDENKALFDADTKFYQRAANNAAGAEQSGAVSSAAASLEISSASGEMRNLELAETAMAQAGVEGQSVNVTV